MVEVEIKPDGLPDGQIRQILRLRNIAVVGMSRDPAKAGHFVPKYLMRYGYRIIPINPSADEILGLKCYPSLLEAPDPIDTVDVFRPSPDVPPIAEAAWKKKAKVLWMQEGIYHPSAAEEAAKRGMTVVWNRCMMKEHQRLTRKGSAA